MCDPCHSNPSSQSKTGTKRNYYHLKLLFNLVIVTVLSFSCQQPYTLEEILDEPFLEKISESLSDLTLNPSSLSLYIGSNAAFYAAGGVPPYSYDVIEGPGTIDSLGVYTAPGAAGSAVIQVTDSLGNTASASVNITDSLTNVDYQLSLVSNTSPLNQGGEVLSGTFTLENIGASDGSKDVNWEVFLSNDLLFSADDELTDTGTDPFLLSGGSAVVPFSGTWPETGGTYYIIVKAYAADDTVDQSNNTAVSAGITITGEDPEDVDYQFVTVPAGAVTYLEGDSITETFKVENAGSEDGSSYIYWSAYLSDDTLLNIGTDPVVDSGSLDGLDGYEVSSSINISGNWPGTAGDYYILISLSAADDIDTGNNTAASTDVFTVVVQPQISPAAASVLTGGSLIFSGNGGVAPYSYSLFSAGSGSPTLDTVTGDYQAGDSAGTDIIRLTDDMGHTSDCTVNVSTTASLVNYDTVTVVNTGGTAGGGALSGNFTFTNSGSGNGSQNVSWQLYTSLDGSIGGGDQLIDSGTTGALDSGVSSSAVPFSGFWPVPASDTSYFLIVQISALDDQTTADNTGSSSVLVTAPVASDIDYIIGTITNSPSTAEISTPIAPQTFTFTNQGDDPGALDVYWTVYFSNDQVLDGGDTPVDTGVEAFLGAQQTSIPLSIGGNWPASSGLYYLIVQVTAGDDTDPSNNYSVSSAFTITAASADIDYIVTGVTKKYPTISSGSLCAETFDLSNVGGTNGTQPIDWTAYASADQTVDGGDWIIDSGTTPFSGLDSGSSSPGLSMTGSWPSVEGSYYLLVEVSSADETIPGNNTGSNGPYTVGDPPDYSIDTVIYQTTGDPSALLSDHGAFSFKITEGNGHNGQQPVGWNVYASVDPVLDGSDQVVQSGSISALTAGSSSSAVSFSDGVWPVMGSYYYLIISIQAGDDLNSSNNSFVSPVTIYVPEYYLEGGENNSSTGPTTGALTYVTDLTASLEGSHLNRNELIQVDGLMDIKFDYDTYRIVTGPDVDLLDIHAEWSSALDEIEFYLWDLGGFQWVSNESSSLGEPSVPPATFDVDPDSVYYIGVKFMQHSSGTDYSLIIQGR